MILYHGTNAEFACIDLAKCKPFKDFGRAFYLSESRGQAEEVSIFSCNLLWRKSNSAQLRV